jgi:hypothetical protein
MMLIVQHQVALDEHRHLVIWVHHRQVLGLMVEVDVDDLEVHAFSCSTMRQRWLKGSVVPE